MLHVKNNREKIGLCLMLVPVIFSIIAAVTKIYFLFAISFLEVFIIIALVPFCKGYEIIWTFLLTFFTAVPANILIMIWLIGTRIIDFGNLPFNIIIHIFLMLLELSAEEVAACIVSSVVFRKSNSVDDCEGTK